MSYVAERCERSARVFNSFESLALISMISQQLFLVDEQAEADRRMPEFSIKNQACNLTSSCYKLVSCGERIRTPAQHLDHRTTPGIISSRLAYNLSRKTEPRVSAELSSLQFSVNERRNGWETQSP